MTRPPRLPSRDWKATICQLGASAALHAIAAAMLAVLIVRAPPAQVVAQTLAPAKPVDTRHIVFIARDLSPLGGGGGGGGDRQTAPIRRAEGVGTDKITLRIAKPIPTTGKVTPPAADAPVLPALLLEAKPMASGNADVMGLPAEGVTSGTSLGTGSGGGVGTGTGTGIGPGTGPGLGPGSGGGTGGGVYHAGGNVSSPRVITEVKPTYTTDALVSKIQGTVVLEVIVKSDGRAGDMRVIRSLDRELDEQAKIAVEKWRFEPGRLAGVPVDVLVNVVLDFRIR